jgi:hypothetical protein
VEQPVLRRKMPMTVPKVGSRVEAQCSRCKAARPHRVMSLEKGRPKKVRCAKCKDEHPFRKPVSAARSARGKSAREAPGRKDARAGKKGKQVERTEDEEEAPPPVLKKVKSIVPIFGGPGAAPIPPGGAPGTLLKKKDKGKGKGKPGGKPSLPPGKGKVPARSETELAFEKALRTALPAPPQSYRISATFEKGQRVKHKIFGEGVVVQILRDHAAEVIFRDGTRKLAMGR